MNKKLICTLALLLAAALLCGCGGLPGRLADGLAHEREDYAVRELCRFEDMPYERPDLDALRDKAAQLEAALEGRASYRQVTRLLDEVYAMYNSFDTMSTIADIRNCQDLSDEFYAEEYAWNLAAEAEVSQIMEEVYLNCGASRLAERLARDYFWDGFLDEYGPDKESVLTDEYVELAAKESELVAEYRSLTLNPAIEIDGEEWLLMDWLYNAEDDEQINRGYDAYYEKYNPLLGELYIRLVEIRKEQAKLLGYDSYAEMMFDLGYGRDFGVEESDRFVQSVRENLVPLARNLENAGVRDSVWYSLVEESDLEEVLENTANSLGWQAREAYQFMTRYHLYDLAISENKAQMSFQTYLSDYEAPYLFINPNGSTQDILTVTHEFGHYVEGFASFNTFRTMDLAECFSQAMQYLALEPMRELYVDEEVDNLLRMNLLETLDTYLTQASFAAFERAAFEEEELSVEKLNALSLQLAMDYGYFDGTSVDYYAKSWVDVTHFFEQPFYVISYPASAGVALEIYELELKEPGTGFEKFRELIEAEDPGLVGAAAEAGLRNPLTAHRVEEITSFLEEQLASEDFALAA